MFLEMVFIQFIKSKRPLQTSINLLDPEIRFLVWKWKNGRQIQKHILEIEKKYYITWYLGQQSGNVRGIPLYLPFQNGGWTLEEFRIV